MAPSAVARAAGLHHQLLRRSLEGTRLPDDAEEVRALARAAGADRAVLDEMLAAAGYWPECFHAVGPDDPALRALAEALADPDVPPDQRARLRQAVESVARGMHEGGRRQTELERRLARPEAADRADPVGGVVM
jgi:hypothetical protein